MRIAIVGTRAPDAKIVELAEYAARQVIQSDFFLVTGGASGIDQVAMRIGRDRCCVVLPWPSYNRNLLQQYGIREVKIYQPQKHRDWTASVWQFHPFAHRLNTAAFALHARNYGIVRNAGAVIAFPRRNAHGDYGGTGQAIRIARETDVPLLVMDDQEISAGSAADFKERIDQFLEAFKRKAAASSCGT